MGALLWITSKTPGQADALQENDCGMDPISSKSPEKLPAGAKSRRFLSCIYGTTEVVPFQKMGHTRVFPQHAKPIVHFQRLAAGRENVGYPL
jgi:hypothetical protein